MSKKTKKEIAEWVSSVTGKDADFIESIIVENKDRRNGDYSIPCFKLCQY